jgi:urease accessory protein
MTDVPPATTWLAWLALHDSAFPAGRFVHSQGLEAWAAANPHAAEAEVVELVLTAVTDSVAPLDAVFLAHAVRADVGNLPALDALVGTYKLTAASRVAAQNTGRQLALAATHVVPGAAGIPYLQDVLAEDVPGHQAIVEGAVHRHLGVPPEVAVLGFLRGAMVGMLSAAVRLGRIGALAAHRATFAHHDLLVGLARTASTNDLDEVWSTVPELEIHAMRHETASGKLFTT